MPHLVNLPDGRHLEAHEYGDPVGDPCLFFHGLIGSHLQASYIDEETRRRGLRVIAPNRPGVGGSAFVRRSTPLEAVPDVAALADALGLSTFSVIGISGGTPYALATLYRLRDRVRSATVISGMGPLGLPGALKGMDRARRLGVEIGSRSNGLAAREFARWGRYFRAGPEKFLRAVVRTWPEADQAVFRREEIFRHFLDDLRQVYTTPDGVASPHAASGLAQELRIYRHYGFPLTDLPADRRVLIWHGLSDTIVPPAMAWGLARVIPSAEAHFVPGGHFMAVDAAPLIVARLRQWLDGSPA
jgi:pimeloyl-ACP methyl ester carboxylesterase